MKPSGLYIHIPYCRSKCLYCDFFSGGCSDADWATLSDALLGELGERVAELPDVPDTLYIGGGTPSLMPAESFAKLIAGVKSIAGICEGCLSEFTLEVNPEDVCPDNCLAWKEAGVNRVSMGVQSLNDVELKTIGRRHDSDVALRALSLLGEWFDNVTCDLIFGLPGQTVKSWERSLDGVLRYDPRHLSAYSLMFEERTPLTVLRDKGRLSFPKEEECLEMWSMLTERLKSKGMMQYEISNYAFPGYESIHNRQYWLGNPYLGIGPSAHSYDGCRVRRFNPHDLKKYLFRFSKNVSEVAAPFYREEILSDTELYEEMVMLRLRMREGLDLKEFESEFGKNASDRLIRNSMKDLSSGNLKREGNVLRLTHDGIMIADDIILRLVL